MNLTEALDTGKYTVTRRGLGGHITLKDGCTMMYNGSLYTNMCTVDAISTDWRRVEVKPEPPKNYNLVGVGDMRYADTMYKMKDTPTAPWERVKDVGKVIGAESVQKVWYASPILPEIPQGWHLGVWGEITPSVYKWFGEGDVAWTNGIGLDIGKPVGIGSSTVTFGKYIFPDVPKDSINPITKPKLPEGTRYATKEDIGKPCAGWMCPGDRFERSNLDIEEPMFAHKSKPLVRCNTELELAEADYKAKQDAVRAAHKRLMEIRGR